MLLLYILLPLFVALVSPRSVKDIDNKNYIQQVNDETVCSHNLGIYVVRMQDSTPANTQIGLLNCSDLNGNVTYQASGSQNALAIFNVQETTGQITLRNQNHPEFEYTLSVLVYSDNVMATNLTVNIFIDFYPPECTETEISIEMADDQISCNSSAPTLTCQDPQGGVFNFTSSSTLFDVNDADGGSFQICPATSLENKVGMHKVVVMATNQIGGVVIVVTVTVTDVNSPPRFINLRNFTISEKSAVGANLGIIQAQDSDVEATFTNLTFSIADVEPDFNPGVFYLDGNNNLRLGMAVNASVISEYTLTLMVTDGGGLSNLAEFIVNIEDQNELPVCSQNSLTVNVDTRMPVGHTVAEVNCLDPDHVPKYKKIVYGLSGNVDGLFSINQNGKLKVAKALPDQDQSLRYQISVRDQQMVETNNTGLVIPVSIEITRACTQGCVNGECVNGQCVCNALHSGEDCNSMSTGAVVGFTVVVVGLLAAVVLLVGYVAFGFNPFSCLLGLVRG